MLQLASVTTTGGLQLFSTSIQTNVGVMIEVTTRIMDSKNMSADLTLDVLRISYLYDAILGLLFVIAWRKEIELEYPQQLLHFMCLQWKEAFKLIIWQGNPSHHPDDIILSAPPFDHCWTQAYNQWLLYIEKREKQGTVMSKFNQKKKKKQHHTQQKQQVHVENNEQKEKDSEWQSLSPRERILRLREEKKKKQVKVEKNDKEEEKRVWIDGTYTKEDLKKYDRSKKQKSPSSSSNKYHSSSQDDEKLSTFVESDEEVGQSTFLTKWVDKLKGVIGDKVIKRQDLSDILNEFKHKLMSKNVAQEVAVQLSQAVGQTLLRSKTKSFTTVHKTVKDAMRDALRKLLTPKNKIDIIVQVTKHREKMKPYVIVFIGVNGVGKSTNLAKVAYKLKSAKLSVMLAACDNFRAGAVEQIETHGRNLDIPVFQKGYKEEPATIAYEAIKDATRKRIDAVLVDTAGRMQDNTPLMKELAHLVKVNQPNLVVFIGQALVGNDAVDQITKFNKALEEQSTPQFKPQIDAILLSKFDTVDDKVGTALSLVYSTSKPILFVGVGQKYPNLKELNVNTVIQSLLS